MHDDILLTRLARLVNQNERLVWRGRHVDTTFLFQTGDDQFLIVIHEGRITSVKKGPFVQANWQFAMRASSDAWSAFWQAMPAPGFHDLMAMVKFKYLKMEGDLYPIMSHLLYFKDVLASVRQAETSK